MTRTAFLLASLLGLSACDPVTMFAGANMATVVHSGKTIPDFILSSQSKKNCSIVHASRNEEYCQDHPPSQKEALAALADTRYCYRTLGGIDCYDRPDFLASGLTRVEFTAGGYLPEGSEPAPLALRDPPGLAMGGIPAPAGPLEPEPVAAPDQPQPQAQTESESGAKPGATGTPPASLIRSAPAGGTSLAQVPQAQVRPVQVSPAPRTAVPPLAPLPGQGTY